MKTLQQLLSTPKTFQNNKDNILLLEIELYNTHQLIELMNKTKAILSNFNNKFIGKALKDKLATLQTEKYSSYVYACVDDYSANLNFRANGLVYRESWDEKNNRIFGVYRNEYKDAEIYCFIKHEPVKPTATILKEWIESIDKSIESNKTKITSLQNSIDNYQSLVERKKTLLAEIKEREAEISGMGVYFNELTKYL